MVHGRLPKVKVEQGMGLRPILKVRVWALCAHLHPGVQYVPSPNVPWGTPPPYVPLREQQHGYGLRGIARSRATSANVAASMAGVGGSGSTGSRDVHSVRTSMSSTPAERGKRILRGAATSGAAAPRQASTSTPVRIEDEQGGRQDSCCAPGTIAEEGPYGPARTEGTTSRATARAEQPAESRADSADDLDDLRRSCVTSVT